ncbi:MAG: Rpn family recombination-promoting nuclease/putative transposase [bacterium]|nr:Rpn family recombination-promoting nuclease/putative transposase [bacterium]
MKPHINPKVDFAFKMLLGNEQHKGLLVHFLNAVLADEPEIHIQTVDLLNPFNEREFENDKLSVVDVKARDDTGRWYQVEIQLLSHAGLIERILYTLCTLYYHQLKKGKAYTSLQPVIAIWILNEPLFDLKGVYHLPFKLLNEEHNLLLSEALRIDLLQLPKWPGPQEVHDELDRWFCLFREAEEADTEHLPDLLQSDEMKEAIQVLHQISESQREYFIYQQRLDALSLEATKQQEREEAERQKDEAERQKDEAERQKDEAERQKDEAERQKDEAERQKDEAQHQKEEAERQKDEAQHQKEEAQRQLAETQKELEKLEQIEQDFQNAKQREAHERQEKERLLALLREASIDPS